MASLPLTSDPEGHFCFLKPSYLTYLWKYSVYYLRYVYKWIGKFMWLLISNTFFKVLLKVTANHVHCKCGNILEKVKVKR